MFIIVLFIIIMLLSLDYHYYQDELIEYYKNKNLKKQKARIQKTGKAYV